MEYYEENKEKVMTPEHIQKMKDGRKNKTKNKVIELSVGLDEKQEAFMKQIDEDCPSRRKLFVKAFGGKSMRACVNANCMACTWMDVDYIRNCKSTICPLWPIRPYRKKK
jgi:hypothetical protein